MKNQQTLLTSLVICVFLFGACIVTWCREAPAVKSHEELYELRVCFDCFDPQKEPQIKTQIKVGSLFFGRGETLVSNSPASLDHEKQARVLYLISGVLHESKDGKFILEHCCLVLWSSSSFQYGPNSADIELDKPYSCYLSDGIGHSYTVVLSRIAATPQANKNEADAKQLELSF